MAITGIGGGAGGAVLAETRGAASRSSGIMDRTVRPFTVTDALKRALDGRPKFDAEDTALLCWGEPSEFLLSSFGSAPSGGGLTVQWDADNDGKDDDNKDVSLCDAEADEYQEVCRETRKIRVENPNDPNQYVIVERALAITLQSPAGTLVRFNFNYPA